MKRDHQFSLLGRFSGGKTRHKERPAADAPATPGPAQPAVALSGSALEQAYRDLLVENQVLAETSRRLHERLARRDAGQEESPAARELIQAQRNALVERSRRLREVEYQNQQLRRDQKKLIEENRRLAASLARHMQDIQPLLHQEEVSRRELAQARTALREKSNELAKLTDKYYQLEARSRPQPPPSSAANGRF
jgi:septal ring factor EnvC (AmiA/AmiB activator)